MHSCYFIYHFTLINILTGCKCYALDVFMRSHGVFLLTFIPYYNCESSELWYRIIVPFALVATFTAKRKANSAIGEKSVGTNSFFITYFSKFFNECF